jgi:hypothetical protein
MGSEIKVQVITSMEGDFLPQSEIVLVLVYLIIILFLLHLVREIWMFRSTCWKYLTDFLSNMKCMQIKESSETLGEKRDVNIGSIENSKTVNLSYIMAKHVETIDVEEGLGDRNKWRNGLEMKGGPCGLRRHSILR